MTRYDPKPDIESHWHIQSLIEGQQKRTEDREYHREKVKLADERDHEIREAPVMAATDFFCCKCGEDFKSMSVKEVEIDWSNPLQSIAFYRSKCSQGHWCVRYITDKHHDPYWMQSRAIANDRGNHYGDILQPGETGYNMLYRKI